MMGVGDSLYIGCVDLDPDAKSGFGSTKLSLLLMMMMMIGSFFGIHPVTRGCDDRQMWENGREEGGCANDDDNSGSLVPSFLSFWIPCSCC